MPCQWARFGGFNAAEYEVLEEGRLKLVRAGLRDFLSFAIQDYFVPKIH